MDDIRVMLRDLKNERYHVVQNCTVYIIQAVTQITLHPHYLYVHTFPFELQVFVQEFIPGS